MKRPPGIWILLSAGVLWLSLQDVYGIRATALIFGKSSTTTTTTEATSESSPDETATEVSTEAGNGTKPTLTGNPQIDYIWDPNLPKELNGYNLSEYPFYERVPEDIDFKCDGLHDGFYASVPHKCQVYHHCLFGTRYDFLCANYTAFDQKTFICHFVSEVDCVNSKKYWHRNDALYQAASTTTVKPLIVYTPPSEPHPLIAAAAPGAAAPPPVSPRRPGGRRRPLRRRRPQYDYYEYDDEYDDYYDERPSRSDARRRKRPRPRPRPIYDDEYEEYEDERYERRGPGRRDEERTRKPYDRRGSDDRRPERRRNKDRRKQQEDDKEEEDRYEDERKSDKRPSERRHNKRRPADDYSAEEEDRRRSRPRRPVEDDYEDEEPAKTAPTAAADDKPIIKPSGSSIYDRPRAAPKIKPPVPKNEASKYAYKTVTTKAPPLADEEYYDDYEEAPKSHRKSESSDSRKHSSKREEERDTRKQLSSRLRTSSSRDSSYEEEPPRRPHKPKYSSHHRERQRASQNKKQPVSSDYYDDYEDVSKESTRTESKVEKQKEKSTTTTTTTTTTTPKPTTTTTTTTAKPSTTTPKELRPETIVRIVKRPFLPSRGGNPYSARGLQPVGTKAVDKKPESKEETHSDDETVETKPLFKPSPVIIKMPLRQKYSHSQTDSSQEEFKPVSSRPQTVPRQNVKPNKEYSGPRTTQKPKVLEPDPLDALPEDEYDVTLNDALNPTLPNLPVRGYPSGFSSSSDYNYQRPRYVLEEANSNYYQGKPARQRFEAVSYNNNPQDQFVNSDADYKGQYSTINRETVRPRVTQAYFVRF